MSRRSTLAWRQVNTQRTGRHCALEIAAMCPDHPDRELTTRIVPTDPQHASYRQVYRLDTHGRETAARKDGEYVKADESLPLTERIVDKRTYTCPVPACRRKLAVPPDRWDAIMLALAQPNRHKRWAIRSDYMEQLFRLSPKDAAQLIEAWPESND